MKRISRKVAATLVLAALLAIPGTARADATSCTFLDRLLGRNTNAATGLASDVNRIAAAVPQPNPPATTRFGRIRQHFPLLDDAARKVDAIGGKLISGHRISHGDKPPPGSAIHAKGTFFGNLDDPYMDGKPNRHHPHGSGTWAGQGAYGKLRPGISMGMTPMMKRHLHAKGGDPIAAMYSDGTVVHGVLDDIGTDSVKGRSLGYRVDVYARNQTEKQLTRSKYAGAVITNVWIDR